MQENKIATLKGPLKNRRWGIFLENFSKAKASLLNSKVESQFAKFVIALVGEIPCMICITNGVPLKGGSSAGRQIEVEVCSEYVTRGA